MNKEERGKRRIEIKKFGRGYYVYESTSVWDKSKKRVRKVSSSEGEGSSKEDLCKRASPRAFKGLYCNQWREGDSF
jgi:hypothetical protein